MCDKHSLESFIADIDKIVSGESGSSSEYEGCDEEYKELLFLAQMLAKADYTPENRERINRIKKMLSAIPENGEIEDDELDMVAGGVNLNDILDKKDGI
ncbi:hypothetical protein ABDB91_18150 [Desulfoscipio sp. XC116]|uniref:hypothetical protein n=1 Tax=Desulfoscipio sp. XC116 TaxID=3144975 RepID=UPI00325AB9A9